MGKFWLGQLVLRTATINVEQYVSNETVQCRQLPDMFNMHPVLYRYVTFEIIYKWGHNGRILKVYHFAVFYCFAALEPKKPRYPTLQHVCGRSMSDFLNGYERYKWFVPSTAYLQRCGLQPTLANWPDRSQRLMTWLYLRHDDSDYLSVFILCFKFSVFFTLSVSWHCLKVTGRKRSFWAREN